MLHRYAVLEEAIARQNGVAGDEERPPARQSLLSWITRGALGSGEMVFVQCIHDIREELERLDAEFKVSIAALTSTVDKLKEEATPRPVLGRGVYERETMEILHKGRVRGLKNALKDVYKKTFILIQVTRRGSGQCGGRPGLLRCASRARRVMRQAQSGDSASPAKQLLAVLGTGGLLYSSMLSNDGTR